MSKKKYKLKCFSCGDQFNNKTEVYRNYDKTPICGECLANDSYPYEEDPRSDQERIDEANIARYGEC